VSPDCLHRSCFLQFNYRPCQLAGSPHRHVEVWQITLHHHASHRRVAWGRKPDQRCHHHRAFNFSQLLDLYLFAVPFVAGKIGTCPKIFAKTSADGVRIYVILFSSFLGLLALLNYTVDAGKVFTYLVDIKSAATFVAWAFIGMLISVCERPTQLKASISMSYHTGPCGILTGHGLFYSSVSSLFSPLVILHSSHRSTRSILCATILSL
jgi:hypothetical protein